MSKLAHSYAYCERVARERAKNFYYSFLVLPEEKRRAMCAIYAFMRECDDLSDEEGSTLDQLAKWRADMEAALAGRPAPHLIWPAFADVVRKYEIPRRYFHEMIDGVSSDLEPRHVRTFEDLSRYCYLVASVVGLTTIHVFGFSDLRAVALAEKCGIAFQLTNIIRDIREDALDGRVYLPEEDLAQFGVTNDSLRATETSEAVRRLLEFEGTRARGYYRESQPLISMVSEDSRPALWALIEIYRRLLERIAERRYDVMVERIALGTGEKLNVLAQAWGKRLF